MSVRTRPLLNRVLTTKLGLPVIEIEVVALRAGNEFDLEFVRDTGEWRRGVYLMTEGQLEIDSVGGSQLEVWRDTAPSVVPVTCRKTSGYLEMFNIWDRGRGMELRRLHSGMIRTQVAERTFEYQCLDSEPDPSVKHFERFVIRLTFKPGMSLPEPLLESDRNEPGLTTAQDSPTRNAGSRSGAVLREQGRPYYGSSNVALPAFRYHPDPIATRSVVRSTSTCPVCGQQRGYIYTGPVFSAEEVEELCPWCIADGSAADRFEAEFTDLGSGVPAGIAHGVLVEIGKRTPGFAGWQQEHWLFHCDDGAAYLGRVGYAELMPLGDALETLREEGFKRGWAPDQIDAYVKSLSAGASPTAYLFRCLHCGTHLAYSDFD